MALLFAVTKYGINFYAIIVLIDGQKTVYTSMDHNYLKQMIYTRYKNQIIDIKAS